MSAEVIFNANTAQKWKVSIPVNNGTLEGTITFQPFKDEFWKEYNAPFENISDDELENMKIALQRDEELWRKLQPKGEFGIEDWEDYFELEEKQDLLRRISVVRIKSVKKLDDGNTEIKTECYFEGKPVSQVFVLRKKTFDHSSRYKLLESKQYKSIGDDKFEMVNQDKEKAELLNDLLVLKVKGIQDEIIPTRFSTLIIDNFFKSKLGKK
jgi:hypothetical protein